jgi:hypothetical protein
MMLVHKAYADNKAKGRFFVFGSSNLPSLFMITYQLE